MGQKVHPLAVRLGFIQTWNSRWYARNDFAKLLHEDIAIRKFIVKELSYAGLARIEIERASNRVRIILSTARPGVIIGRKGQEIDRLRDELANMTEREILIDVKEVKLPQCNAQLISENIAFQLQRRVHFRRAMKRALQTAISRGVQGIKLKIGGRLGGSEIARQESYHEGKVPLQTFRADVQYGFSEARTTYGTIGVKVWVYQGDVIGPKEESKERDIKEQAKGARKEKPKEAPNRPAKQTNAWTSDALWARKAKEEKGKSNPGSPRKKEK
jgi:small subunit ribosomal protein S3